MKKYSPQDQQKSALSIVLYLVIALGVFLAIYQFLFNRSLWLDEAMLALNIINKGFLELLKPLDSGQAAPIGFLFVERLSVLVFGKNDMALRIFSLMSFLLTIPFFYGLAKKLTDNHIVALLSTSIFSISLVVLRYSSEVKQYPIDILFTMMILYFSLALSFDKNRSLFIYAILGVVAIWFSNTSVIILTVTGLFLLYSELYKKKNYKIMLPFLFWVISLGIYYYFFVYGHPLAEFMKSVWSHAFMPLNPFSKELYIFIIKEVTSMYRWLSFSGYSWIVHLQLIISLVAIVFMIKNRKYILLYFIISPLLIHLLLSSFEMYPFTERFLLYAVPLMLLVYVYGIYSLFDLINKKIMKLPSLLLALPVLIMFYPIYKNFPIELEEIKNSLSYMEKNIKNDETVYIYHASNKAYSFYKNTNIIDINNTIITGTYFKAKKHQNDKRLANFEGKLENLDSKLSVLEGQLSDLEGKVWLLFSHVYRLKEPDNEEKYIVDILLRQGAELLDVRKYKGSSVYYIDTKKSYSK